MQDSLHAAETVEIPAAAPFELSAEQLELVSGGATAAGPHDNWAVVAGPHDNW